MSAFEKDRQKQISDDTIKAANDDKALHDDRNTCMMRPRNSGKTTTQTENEFNSWTAEHELRKAEGFEKLMRCG